MVGAPRRAFLWRLHDCLRLVCRSPDPGWTPVGVPSLRSRTRPQVVIARSAMLKGRPMPSSDMDIEENRPGASNRRDSRSRLPRSKRSPGDEWPIGTHRSDQKARVCCEHPSSACDVMGWQPHRRTDRILRRAPGSCRTSNTCSLPVRGARRTGCRTVPWACYRSGSSGRRPPAQGSELPPGPAQTTHPDHRRATHGHCGAGHVLPRSRRHRDRREGRLASLVECS